MELAGKNTFSVAFFAEFSSLLLGVLGVFGDAGSNARHFGVVIVDEEIEEKEAPAGPVLPKSTFFASSIEGNLPGAALDETSSDLISSLFFREARKRLRVSSRMVSAVLRSATRDFFIADGVRSAETQRRRKRVPGSFVNKDESLFLIL